MRGDKCIPEENACRKMEIELDEDSYRTLQCRAQFKNSTPEMEIELLIKENLKLEFRELERIFA